MSINLSIRNYQLTVGGLDCSRALVSFTGCDSKLDQSGLITFSGDLVLGRPAGFESLDDRRNTRWCRGADCGLELADSTGTLRPSPRGAVLRVLDARYEPALEGKSRLKIRLGDALEFLRFKEPLTDAAKICLGTNTPRTDVINRLLAAAGAPALVDTVPGVIGYPLPKLLEGSFIDQAGAIAAAVGHFLFVDSLGQVRAAAIDTRQPSAIISITATTQQASVERLQGEQPPSLMIAKGQCSIVLPTVDRKTGRTEETGTANSTGSTSTVDIIVGQSKFIDEFDRDTKERLTFRWLKAPRGTILPDLFPGDTSLFESEYQEELLVYEAKKPLRGFAFEASCQQGNQGRLLYRRLLKKQRAGAILKSVYATYPSNVFVNRLAFITSEVDETWYQYDTESFSGIDPVTGQEDFNPSTIVLGKGPRILNKKSAPIGSIIPNYYGYRFGQVKDPTELVQSEATITYYQERNLGEWAQSVQVWQALAVASPAIADYLATELDVANNPINLRKLVEPTIASDTTQIANNGNTQPPQPDTYPPPFQTQERTILGKAKLPVDGGSPYRQWQRELEFAYLSSTIGGLNQVEEIRQQANALAQTWGQITWGRFKGGCVMTDLQDQFWGYQPMVRCDVTEPEGVYSYLSDGFALALGGNRCVVSFDGILMGYLAGGVVIPPYRQQFDFQQAAGGAAQFTLYRYSRQPSQIAYQQAGGNACQFTIASGNIPVGTLYTVSGNPIVSNAGNYVVRL